QPGRLRRQLGGPPPVAGCVGHEPRGPLAPPPPVNAAPLASRENLRRLLHEVGPLLRFRCPAFEPRDVGAPLLRVAPQICHAPPIGPLPARVVAVPGAVPALAPHARTATRTRPHAPPPPAPAGLRPLGESRSE